MPYSKDPNSYPAEFFTLVEKASQEEVEISFDTAREAMAFRHKFYSFRRALLNTKDDLAPLARKLEIYLPEETKIVVRVSSITKALESSSAGDFEMPEMSDDLKDLIRDQE